MILVVGLRAVSPRLFREGGLKGKLRRTCSQFYKGKVCSIFFLWSGRGLLCFGRLNIGNENTSVDMALLSWEHRIAISKAKALLVLLPGSELEALLSKPGLRPRAGE